MCHKSQYSKSVAAQTVLNGHVRRSVTILFRYPTDFKNERNERVVRISNRMEYRNKIFMRNAAKARSDFIVLLFIYEVADARRFVSLNRYKLTNR